MSIFIFRYKKSIFPHSYHHWLSIFASNKHEPACCTDDKFAPVEASHFFHNNANYITHCLTEFTSTFLSFCNYWWVKCFLQEEIQWYTLTLYVLSSQIPFWQFHGHLLKCPKWYRLLTGSFQLSFQITKNHFWLCGISFKAIVLC